jgi:4'-phosphopantetheinyl transferase
MLLEVFAGWMPSDPLRDPKTAALASALLSPAERDEAARLRRSRARRDYIGAHALVRTLVNRRLGCAPHLVTLQSDPLGRPRVMAPAAACGLTAGLSQADGVVCCAIAAGCFVGVDVESVASVGRDPLRVARLICSEAEQEDLHTLPGGARAARLVSMWTIKEAIAKATGLGYHLSLTSITVRAAPDGALRVDYDAALVAPGGIHVNTWWLTDHHVATIAVLGPPDVPICMGRIDLPPARAARARAWLSTATRA